MTSLLTFPSNGTLVEVTLTDEQAGDITHSRPVTWTSPELPDSGIDEDGTIITAEDARPIL